jgi:hypothetical protein
MKRAIFNCIFDVVNGCDPFIEKMDAAKKLGIHPLCIFVACLRVLAYGNSADIVDESLQLSESSLHVSLTSFCSLIVEKFGPKYLNRSPNRQEIRGLLSKMAKRGFPGCFASWDCKHFDWSNCPVRMQGQYKNGKEKKRTIVLEAIADVDHYIWHIFFGSPGAMNDINVLDKSPILGAIHRGDLNIMVDEYLIDGKPIDFMYFLVDGIYPDLAYFVKTLNNPINEKERFFCQVQEGTRKSVECAFGELVKKWHILKNPIRKWYIEDIDMMVKTCVILHNIIVEERRGDFNEREDDTGEMDDTFKRLSAGVTQDIDHEEGRGIAEPESAHDVDSFSFLGTVEEQYQSNLEKATSREDISSALSERIHMFIQHTENGHRSLALRMALINHIWKKKQNCMGNQGSSL